MSAEDREMFQLSDICWICDKLFDAGDNKVRDQFVQQGNIEVLHIGVVILILN